MSDNGSKCGKMKFLDSQQLEAIEEYKKFDIYDEEEISPNFQSKFNKFTPEIQTEEETCKIGIKVSSNQNQDYYLMTDQDEAQ